MYEAVKQICRLILLLIFTYSSYGESLVFLLSRRQATLKQHYEWEWKRKHKYNLANTFFNARDNLNL